MPMGMSRWGFFGLLRRRRDGVKSDVSEEDDARPAQDAGPAEVAAGARSKAGGMKGCQLAGLM